MDQARTVSTAQDFSGHTPMMAQYLRIKAEHPDTLTSVTEVNEEADVDEEGGESIVTEGAFHLNNERNRKELEGA